MPYVGPVQISWQTADGSTRYAQGKCVDVSEGGLRVEVSHPIPVRTSVSLRADRIKLAGSARVKHSTRHGARYMLGLELSQVLIEKALTAVREPGALRSPAYTG